MHVYVGCIVCMYVCVYVCIMYVCMCVCVCMYVCVCICKYIGPMYAIAIKLCMPIKYIINIVKHNIFFIQIHALKTPNATPYYSEGNQRSL